MGPMDFIPAELGECRWYKYVLAFFFPFLKCIYLAVLGLSCSVQDLRCVMWDFFIAVHILSSCDTWAQ